MKNFASNYAIKVCFPPKQPRAEKNFRVKEKEAKKVITRKSSTEKEASEFDGLHHVQEKTFSFTCNLRLKV